MRRVTDHRPVERIVLDGARKDSRPVTVVDM